MSAKPVAAKLLIKENYRVLFINRPEGYLTQTGGLPPGVTVLNDLEGIIDLIQLFVTSKKQLEAQLAGVTRFLAPKGLLWVTYPKGTSKVKADINRDSINAYAKSLGLQGVAMVAIDDTWSALRLKPV
jgi:hypothetical protein